MNKPLTEMVNENRAIVMFYVETSSQYWHDQPSVTFWIPWVVELSGKVAYSKVSACLSSK